VHERASKKSAKGGQESFIERNARELHAQESFIEIKH
jgi:hypothetical protein